VPWRPAGAPRPLGAPVPEDELDRRAVEAQHVADPVLEVAPVREVDQLRSLAKKMNVGGSIPACVA